MKMTKLFIVAAATVTVQLTGVLSGCAQPFYRAFASTVSISTNGMGDLVYHEFGNRDLRHRLLRGGLPPFFLAPTLPERDFQEWMDAYWAKDIQELFRLERRTAFQRLVELLLARSGGIFEATEFARLCEISRPTVTSYLGVLEATAVAHVIRPFSTRRTTEIVAAPKVYGFDTGFVCYYRGWSSLRADDLGILWEHFVLNEILATLQGGPLHYWRDKAGHEVAAASRGIGNDDRDGPCGILCGKRVDRNEN